MVETQTNNNTYAKTSWGGVSVEITATDEAMSEDGAFDKLMSQVIHTLVAAGIHQLSVEKWLDEYNETTVTKSLKGEHLPT